eukprot:m.50304 g.50304  ORF g.50304 m.50304 type:complete len:564 (+) comp6213_c0_seq4:196-1887(+)
MEVGSSALMVDTSARVDIPAKNLQFHRFLHNNSKFYIRAPVFDLFERLNRLREGNREEYRLLKRGFRSPVLLLGGFPGSGKSTAVWTWMIQQVYKTNASAVFWLFSPENKGLYLRKPDSSSCSFIFTDLPKVLEAQRPDLVIVDGLTVEISSRSSNAMSPGAQVLRVIRNYLHDSKHALAVATTSREIHFSGTLAQDLQSLDFQKHTLPSWTLEDYVAAVELDEYYGQVVMKTLRPVIAVPNSVVDPYLRYLTAAVSGAAAVATTAPVASDLISTSETVGIAADAIEAVKWKYYWAGGNARFMFECRMSEIIAVIKTLARECCSDTALYGVLDGIKVLSTQSHHLLQQCGPHCGPVSQYCAKELMRVSVGRRDDADIFAMEYLKFAEKLGNLGVLGTAFQVKVQSVIRGYVRLRTAVRLAGCFVLNHRDSSQSLIHESVTYPTTKPRTPTIIMMTISREHNLEEQYLKTAIERLLDCGLAIRQVVHTAIVPHNMVAHFRWPSTIPSTIKMSQRTSQCSAGAPKKQQLELGLELRVASLEDLCFLAVGRPTVPRDLGQPGHASD